MTGPRRRLLRLAAALGGAALAAASVEVGARVAGRGPATRGPSLEATFWVRDARLGFRNRPGASLRYHATGSFVTTGPHGERTSWQGPGGGPTVLFVGDSTTFCAEVDDDLTGPSQVARRLPPGLGATVVNAGVRGYGTLQALRMADEWLTRRPARVVVYLYCQNDVLENVQARAHPPAVAPAARLVDGALVVDEAPAAYAVAGAPVGLDPPPPPFGSAAWLLERLAARSALVTLLLPREAGDVVERGARDALAGDGPAVLRALLGELAARCAAGGATLVVSEHTSGDPTDHLMTPPGLVEGLCRELGVRFVDLRPAFSGPARRYRTVLRTGALDGHWGPEGTATFAEALTPHLVPLLGP
ncbi:MAG: SGNH/GDSL hydrolase family protein [Planctomycetes bacterium]|nr:SGNH/GDSL hydrolase family protein [Planctomycetota bacterium]